MKIGHAYEFTIQINQLVTDEDIRVLMRLAIQDGYVSDWCLFRNAETMRKVSATSAAKILLSNGELVVCGTDGRNCLILLRDILEGIEKFIELGYDQSNLFDHRRLGGKNHTELLTKKEVNHIIHLAAFGKPFGD